VSEAVVLDSSAVICLLSKEVGWQRVGATLRDAAISSVNLAEVVTKLWERGLSAEEVRLTLAEIPLDVRAFSAEEAYITGELRVPTRRFGLSLGDRACLALAAALGRPALTADRQWSNLDVGVQVVIIR
jgi:ribonuclease VapC